MKRYNTERGLIKPSGADMAKLDRLSLGRFGEDEAAIYLLNEGFEILKRNFRNRSGEVDIIAKKGASVHFIEVKTRRTGACGYPEESVSGLKKNKILRTALWYLNGEGCSFKHYGISFALIAIYINGGMINLKYIEF